MNTATVRARNYVNIDVHDGKPLRPLERTAQGYALRFAPGDYLETSRQNPTVGGNGNKFVCGGAGWIDYALKLPERVDANAIQGLRVVFEAGVKDGGRAHGLEADMARSPATATRKPMPRRRAAGFK